jgi:hypothetical protein
MLNYKEAPEDTLAKMIKDSDANLLMLQDMMSEVKKAIKDYGSKS